MKAGSIVLWGKNGKCKTVNELNEQENLSYKFYQRKSLKEIPRGVTFASCTNMTAMFYGSGLEKAPVVPASVTTMSNCFRDCTALVETPDMTGCVNLTDVSACFVGCTALVETPDFSKCTKLTNMSQSLYGCSKLTEPPLLPEGVKSISIMLPSCGAMTGNLHIPESVTSIAAVCGFSCGITSVTGTLQNVTTVDGVIGGVVGAFGYANKLAELDENVNMRSLTKMVYTTGGVLLGRGLSTKSVFNFLNTMPQCASTT